MYKKPSLILAVGLNSAILVPMNASPNWHNTVPALHNMLILQMLANRDQDLQRLCSIPGTRVNKLGNILLCSGTDILHLLCPPFYYCSP